MTQLTPISSRKRRSPDEAGPDDSSTCETGSPKRQRKQSPRTPSSSGLHLSMPRTNVPPTPPTSAKGTATMALRLIIPHEHISREQQKKLNRHRADAERWKPKLQRPYPNKTEIKHAYPLKLMRHYPDATVRTQSNFVRPKIDESPRVSRLLEQFPFTDTARPVRSERAERRSSPGTPLDRAIPLSTRIVELKEAREAHVDLQTNIHITETEHAQRLAWQSFSRTERMRVDRGREAMMQSGLVTDDLNLEAAGQWNRLPEWKKPRTGRFALERQVTR